MTIEGIEVRVTPESAAPNSVYANWLKKDYHRSAIRYYRDRIERTVIGEGLLADHAKAEIAALERLIADHLNELEKLEQLSD